MGDDVNMGTEFEGIKPGAKVVPLDENCSEWQKAKEMGQPYLMVMAVRYELSGNICAVTANEKSRFVKVEWLSEEKLIPMKIRHGRNYFRSATGCGCS